VKLAEYNLRVCSWKMKKLEERYEKGSKRERERKKGGRPVTFPPLPPPSTL